MQNVQQFLNSFFSTPGVSWIMGIGVLILLFNIIVSIVRRIKNSNLINDAPQLAQNMQPGQTIVKTLNTINDEKISRFLSAFPGDEFRTSIHTRRINEVNKMHYTTVVKIYKKEK